ncbi:pancreatic lipase-related protein 2-like [Dendronephthya gigantea]|uniref:pancreatic lipase-related protein 2-like n=1 Tax=Dendronephthya gigantea TaxID=151771 RepID=UPI0010694D21|nr:pancreatic lipase-related protein 2-like [Dendronephthya gigantea]
MIFVIIISVAFFSGVRGQSKICYGKYGCFSDGGDFQGIFTQLPSSPASVAPSFALFTRRTPPSMRDGEILDDSDMNKLRASTFNEHSLTKFVTHGYIEPKFGIRDWMLRMKDELLFKGDYNVILVSWHHGNNFPYVQAAANTRIVAAMLSELLLFLVNNTVATCDKIHLIGFSLGAHISGYAGKRCLSKGCVLNRITGLDPAGPLFEDDSPVVRLDRGDAEFVDVIHTDIRVAYLGVVGSFGIIRAIGDADFYPNGGYNQPGCRNFSIDLNIVQTLKDLVVCSHARAVLLFLESINSKCMMRSYSCTTKWLFDHGQCSSCKDHNSECQIMGFYARSPPAKHPVSYQLRTRSESPFCGYHYKITVYTSDSFRGGLESTIQITLTGKYGSKNMDLEERNHERGSSQSFVVLIGSNLGSLQKIKISYNKFYAVWHLDRVVVQPSWMAIEYTACFNSWLIFNMDKEADLKQGTVHC